MMELESVFDFWEVFHFIILDRIVLRGLPQKILGPRTCKLWRNLLLEGIKISKIGQQQQQQLLLLLLFRW